jgi:hypothetical protein
MILRNAIVACLLFLPTLRADDTFPLLGLWRISHGGVEGQPTPQGNGEMLFQSDGKLVVTATSPDIANGKPISKTVVYTFSKPNLLTYNIDGSIKERWKFFMEGDKATLTNLDYKVTVYLKKVDSTIFTEPSQPALFPLRPVPPDIPKRENKVEQDAAANP